MGEPYIRKWRKLLESKSLGRGSGGQVQKPLTSPTPAPAPVWLCPPPGEQPQERHESGFSVHKARTEPGPESCAQCQN